MARYIPLLEPIKPAEIDDPIPPDELDAAWQEAIQNVKQGLNAQLLRIIDPEPVQVDVQGEHDE